VRTPYAANARAARRRNADGAAPRIIVRVRGDERSDGTPDFGVVVLTMNDRPAEMRRALTSLLGQRDVRLDVVVVGNGCEPEDVPAGVRTIALPDNVGIPEGRNAGAAAVAGRLLFFLDNDAYLPRTTILRELTAVFDRDPTVAYVQPRIVDPDGRPTPRRWVPRLRAGDPERSSVATVMAEGVVVVRRDAFDEAGQPSTLPS